jgi:Multidrug resistance efflux pump
MNMKKFLPIVIVALAVIISALYFEVFRYWDVDKSKIEGSGTIEVTEIEISSKVAGRVTSLPADEGSAVKEGDLIVKLNYDELSAQRSSAMANLSYAEQNLERKRQLFKKRVVLDDEQSAQLASAMANLSNAEKNLERMRQLFKKGVISDRELENAETVYKVSQSNVNLVSATIERALESAETAYTVSQSNVDLVSATIKNAVIYSPIDGVVLKKNLEIGEMAFPGSAIITVADLKKPWVNIYVDEKKFGLIKLGQKAYVKVDSFPDRKFPGVVVLISNKAEFTPRTIQTKDERVKLMYAIKISVENPGMELKPGMPADATIILELKK